MAAIWARSLARSGGYAQAATSPDSGARISDAPAVFFGSCCHMGISFPLVTSA